MVLDRPGQSGKKSGRFCRGQRTVFGAFRLDEEYLRADVRPAGYPGQDHQLFYAPDSDYFPQCFLAILGYCRFARFLDLGRRADLDHLYDHLATITNYFILKIWPKKLNNRQLSSLAPAAKALASMTRIFLAATVPAWAKASFIEAIFYFGG